MQKIKIKHKGGDCFQGVCETSKVTNGLNRKEKFMKRRLLGLSLIAIIIVTLVTVAPVAAKGFIHGIVINVDGEDYYLDGAPDGPDGAYDIPGHWWVQTGENKLVGKHYNTGPFGAAQWWSSDAPDGKLLYMVTAIIDTWTPEKAEMYASRGYVHYHELVAVDGGVKHPDKVVWLKHIARTSFTLDGGPGAPNPPYEHEVTPGVDYLFPVNGTTPYDPS